MKEESGKLLDKEGIIDKKFHRWLLDAFDQRIIGDYGVEAVITQKAIDIISLDITKNTSYL